MTVVMGIDTGGTYTDAALVDHESGAVLAAAKALTTRHDLTVGIAGAVAAVCGQANQAGASLSMSGQLGPERIGLVALSTTFATNAIAEGQGSPICLLLIGYDRELMEQYGFESLLPTDDVVYVPGGHDLLGNEATALDEQAIREAVASRAGLVEAFAVSSYFGVRNPTHELRAKALIEELTAAQDRSGARAPLPVTCGHELTSNLNAVRRATTVALNARLIPLLRELITSVRRTLEAHSIEAPLMVVKGDGSLVRAEWAMRRPIETILSGPAASAVGAWHLMASHSARPSRDVWVVDIGGTTTDIAALHDGRPRLNPEGAQVGGWRTMVEAVDVHTAGLGGDSHVRLDPNGHLRIGPRRVVPLCLLAEQYPSVVEDLRQEAAMQDGRDPLGQFVLLRRRPASRLSEEDRGLLHDLEAGPRPLARLLGQTRYAWLLRRRIEDLETGLVLQRGAFTPTDALHVLGRLACWNTTAARLGAELLARQAGMSAADLCERVVRGTSDVVTTELVSKALGDEVGAPDWRKEPTAAALLKRALEGAGTGGLGCQLHLQRSIVAIGAPVSAYMPRVAATLQTELFIPEHADVANAVGAVAGGVVVRQHVVVNALEGSERVRLHLPAGPRDAENLEQGVLSARQEMEPYLQALAKQAGAEQVEVQVTRADRRARVGDAWGEEIYLGSDLHFTAVGRPSPARPVPAAR